MVHQIEKIIIQNLKNMVWKNWNSKMFDQSHNGSITIIFAMTIQKGYGYSFFQFENILYKLSKEKIKLNGQVY